MQGKQGHSQVIQPSHIDALDALLAQVVWYVAVQAGMPRGWRVSTKLTRLA